MHKKAARLISSQKFFYIIIALLVFQAVWIALSGRYPMAFDEDYHFGIIRLYAHHLTPFWSSQPTGADIYGGVYREPSYMYHYLLSFPYRFLSLFVHGQASQIIILRFINIGLFASALPLFRRLLRKVNLSDATIHSLLALFVFVPVVPLLAAQINYDNLLIPLVALNLLLALRVQQTMHRYKRIDVQTLGILLIGCLLTSLVKSAFLPIFVGIAIFLLISAHKYIGLRNRKFWLTFGFGISLMGRRARWVLLGILLLSIGLFLERYGVDIIRYHTLDPDCSQVLSVDRCQAYGPSARDHYFEQIKPAEISGPFGYTMTWFGAMWVRLFFAVDGPATQFQTRGPLPVPSLTALVLLSGGLLLVAVSLIKHDSKIYRNTVLLFYIFVGLFYVLVLWFQDYRAYTQTGQPVAINGRYLLPVMLLLLTPIGLAYQRISSVKIKATIIGLALFFFLWGGGFLTYVLRSNESWYWNSPPVLHMNDGLRQLLKPVVPGSDDPTKFLYIT